MVAGDKVLPRVADFFGPAAGGRIIKVPSDCNTTLNRRETCVSKDEIFTQAHDKLRYLSQRHPAQLNTNLKTFELLHYCRDNKRSCRESSVDIGRGAGAVQPSSIKKIKSRRGRVRLSFCGIKLADRVLRNTHTPSSSSSRSSSNTPCTTSSQANTARPRRCVGTPFSLPLFYARSPVLFFSPLLRCVNRRQCTYHNGRARNAVGNRGFLRVERDANI